MNHQLYKRKIRRTLILFAILPVFLLTMIGLFAYYAIYIMKTDYELNQVNKAMVSLIENDRKHIQERYRDFPKNIPGNTTDIYRTLYERSNDRKQHYIFKFEYDKLYTNNYGDIATIPMYEQDGEQYRLTISVPASVLKDVMHYHDYHYVVTDLYDNIYYSSDDHLVGDKYSYDERMQITAFHKDDQLKLYVYQDLRQTIDRGIILISILLGTFFLLIMITMYSSKRLAHRQTQDIDEIIAHIRQAQVRALTTYQPLTAQSELEIINRYVFELSQLNERLLKSTKESNEALRQSQLKSLENQFQPHFIFNTMQTINYMIDTDKKAAKKMMIKLSSILRYALRVKESEVTFKKEIDYLEDYVFIQNIRFDQAIHYTIDIDESLMNVQTEKLLIQPLIENSIKYGAIENGLNIKVRIKPLRNGDIYIAVYDDGRGMTKERLKEVRSMIKHYKLRNLHIGMQNIHQTLRVKYGEHYGMKVYSAYNNGTLVTLRVKKGGTYV
ncbi:histidine kinase [Macrococcus caseolyticus]|uniref:sensor histidine kinase n=1 Tax=Macrococcoides caseolyticum TaxID=69966 RepID=UPI0024BC06B6|nr:histidine kinase [Macrococcus caseolyticus]MDJ1156424.1 histidine kinase [Macrococcus caseolyticus]